VPRFFELGVSRLCGLQHVAHGIELVRRVLLQTITLLALRDAFANRYIRDPTSNNTNLISDTALMPSYQYEFACTIAHGTSSVPEFL